MNTPPPTKNETPVNKPERPGAGSGDAWAIRVATVSRIPIRLHFTFLLLIIWFAVSGIGRSGAGMVAALLGLFFCIALHELGHSIVAQRYGYPVRDITLYPIGGVAAIEGSPRPRHELYIALAGPAVNVVIAALLAGVLALTGQLQHLLKDGIQIGAAQRLTLLESSPLAFLLVANITLVLFNMIPAFPMDGGRVLRAVLGLFIGKPRATKIAAGVGQFLAILMGLYGLGIFGNTKNYGLVLIALFVYFGAGQERDVEQTQEFVDDSPVEAAMVRDFQTLAVGDTLRRAAEVLIATSQQDFPVVHGSEVVGVLSRGQLLRGLAENGDGAYVAGTMTREVLFAQADDPLDSFILRPDGVQRAPVLVRGADGNLVGMLTMENLMEFLTLRRISRDRDEQV